MTCAIPRKRVHCWILIGAALAVGLAIAGLARADQSTPFVEGNNQVGARAKEHGYVVSLSNRDQTGLLVLVMTDTREFVAIHATAEPGVVRPDLLGRPVIVDAEILTNEKGRDGKTRVTLKVHGVELPKPKPAAGTDAK